MSADFYDLLKFGKTGIAAPDMTAYDKLMALRMHGSLPMTTITGVPPISFRSDGSPLSAWSIDGNSRQDGTPAPDDPIDPEFVGVRTENLLPLTVQTLTRNGVTFTVNSAAGTVKLEGSLTSDISTVLSIPVPATLVGDYYMSGCPSGGSYSTYDAFMWDTTENARPKKWDGSTSSESDFGSGDVEIKLVSGHSNYYRIRPRYGVHYSGDIVFRPMIRVPSSSPDFEPYGYKLSITSAGQTVPVYLGQAQTVRRIKKIVFDGTEQGWGKNIGLTNSNAYSISLSNWVGNRKIGYCTHYENVTSAEATEGAYFGNSLNILTAISDGLDDATKFKNWLAQEYVNGTPLTVWYVLATPETAAVNEPLAKIGNYADELHSDDVGITIPTVRGINTLTVDTDLQPSQVSITGHIKQS